MEFTIAVLAGEEAGRRSRHRATREAPVLIGRSEDCAVPLWDEAASRRHALLEERPDGLYLVDLGSANGTWIGEARVDRRRLEGGEQIRIGATVLRIETDAFRNRSTEVVRPGAGRPDAAADPYHVVRRLPWDAVDLGSEVSRDEGRARRLNALLDSVREILAAEGGDRILAALLEGGSQVIGARGECAIPCASRSGDPLWAEPIRTSPTRSAPEPSRSLVERVLAEREAVVVSDPDRDPRARGRRSIVGQRVGSWIAVPVLSPDRVHAVALFAGAPDAPPFGAEELALAATLGQITGLALAAADRLETSRQLLRVQSDPAQETPITEDAEFRERIASLERFAAAGGPLLIVGETGTGKELLARAAHRSGPHPEGPWIAVNCAALPEGLLESELFGHEEGAFTGATARRRGLFELADGGTLFLDEIGDLPVDLQPKLLRALESGEFYRIGGSQPVRVEVFVVSATHRDPETLVAEGNFREDLLYRIGRFRIEVPPLRDRPADLVPLAEAFLERARRAHGAEARGFDAKAWEALRLYPWPGNVRELRNVVERASVLAGDRPVGPEDLALPAVPRAEPEGPSASGPPPSLREVEEAAVRAALLHTQGHRKEAARILGVSEPTLRRKLRAYGLDGPLADPDDR